jgi:hypothetical protein
MLAFVSDPHLHTIGDIRGGMGLSQVSGNMHRHFNFFVPPEITAALTLINAGL